MVLRKLFFLALFLQLFSVECCVGGVEALQSQNPSNGYVKPLIGLAFLGAGCGAAYKTYKYYRSVEDAVKLVCDKAECEDLIKAFKDLPSTWNEMLKFKPFELKFDVDQNARFNYDEYKKWIRNTRPKYTRFEQLARAISQDKDTENYQKISKNFKKLQDAKPFFKLQNFLQTDPSSFRKEKFQFDYSFVKSKYAFVGPLVVAHADVKKRLSLYSKYKKKFFVMQKEGSYEDDSFESLLNEVKAREKTLGRFAEKLVAFSEWNEEIKFEQSDLRTPLRKKADKEKEETEKKRKITKKEENKKAEKNLELTASTKSKKTRLASLDTEFKSDSLFDFSKKDREYFFTRLLKKVLILSQIEQYEKDLYTYSRWNMLKRIFFAGIAEKKSDE